MHDTVRHGTASLLSRTLKDMPSGGFWDELPVGIYTCGRDGALAWYNRRAAELWGHSPAAGDPRFRFGATDKAYGANGRPLARDETAMAEMLRTGDAIRDRAMIVERPDGTRLSILSTVDPIFGKGGAIIGGIGCLHEAPPSAGERGESERNFRELLEALPAAVYTTDAAGRITFFNQAAVELAGRRPALGKDEWCVTWRLYWPDGRRMPHDQCPMAVALKENRVVRGAEAVAERPDGTRRPLLPYPTPLRDASGKLVGAINLLIDVSERNQAEIERRRLATLVERSADFIGLADRRGEVIYVNEAGRHLVGLDGMNEVRQTRIADYFPPAERHRVMDEIIPAVIAQGRWVDEIDFQHFKTGERIPVRWDVFRIDDPRTGQAMNFACVSRDLRDQKRTEAALRRLNEGLEQRVEERSHALLNEINERRLVETQLLHAQKMEAIGQLTGGVAHDFNNLLTAIIANLDLIAAKAQSPGMKKLAASALRSAGRGAKLTHQLLAFSRRQRLEPKPTDINELVAGMGELLTRTLGGTVRIEYALSDGLWAALVDPTQLETAILNLSINARDAMPGGGTLTLATGNFQIRQTQSLSGVKPGEYVMIAVTDTGAGMSEDVQARAFDPFFTTKDVGKGSGLGLSQVYGVAQQSGGGVEIDSALGRGTTVRLYMPRIREVLPRRSPAERAAVAAAKRRERILFVDDDEDVREIVAASLRELDFDVSEAESVDAALERLDRETFDMVVMDFAMPRASGADGRRAIAARRPELPVLLITGHADTPALGEDVAVMRKPFAVAELAAKIRSMIGQRRSSGGETVVQLRPRAR